MTPDVSIASAIDAAVNSKLNFCAYRFPDEMDLHFHASHELSVSPSCGAFLVAPFEPTIENIRFIPAELDADQTISETGHDNHIQPQQPEHSTSKDEYMKGLMPILNHLRDNGGKIVYSRITCGKLNFRISDLFFSLAEKYPHAFVHVYKAGNEIWIGATPELLMKADGEIIETVALAGTRPAGTNGEWDNKNIEEQAMVTRFICDTLSEAGLHPIAETPFTRNAGPVEHICTSISASLPGNHCMNNLLCRLAPTPAVSGYPRSIALQMIHKHEKHSRRHYGGTIGIYNNDRRYRLYVNLRSMRITSDQYSIYSGGGITAMSDAETEWEETRLKASTLLSAFPGQ